MPDAGAEDAIGVLDEGKVSALNDVLLVLFAVVEGDLLGILEQARVRKAQLALEGRLVRCVRAKRRGNGLEHECRRLHEDCEQDEALGTDVSRQLVVVQNDVEYGLCER